MVNMTLFYPHWNRKMSSNDPTLSPSRLLPPPLKDCQQGFPARPGWDAASGLGVVTQWTQWAWPWRWRDAHGEDPKGGMDGVKNHCKMVI
jgi:hypothetical protein